MGEGEEEGGGGMEEEVVVMGSKPDRGKWGEFHMKSRRRLDGDEELYYSRPSHRKKAGKVKKNETETETISGKRK